MTPNRWEQVKEIFETALERPSQERAAYLSQACGGDATVRDEVNRLLGEHDRAGEFLNDPLWVGRTDTTSTAGSDGDTGYGVDAVAEPKPPVVLLETGEVFAHRYEIKGELGRGRSGIVYSAFDRRPPQQIVALKVTAFPTAQAQEAGDLSGQRFMEEARCVGKLSQPNIATVFDVGESAGCVYIVQELAPGKDLRAILGETGPLSIRRVLAFVRQICEGLAHAHANGVVHGNIKPGNIVVSSEDKVKITGFRLGQAIQGQDANKAACGTPGYMAPEQLRGERVDWRTDIFAVGCVIYQMLSGMPPFEGTTTGSVIEKTLRAFPLDPSRVRMDLPRALDRIVSRAMRKDAAERYSNITQLEQDMVNYEQFDYLADTGSSAAEVAAALEKCQCTLVLGLRLRVGLDEKHARMAEDLISENFAERLSISSNERRLPRLARDLEIDRGRAKMLKYLAAAVTNPVAAPREVMRRVARLPFAAIVTTVYDTLLEEELAKLNRNVHRIVDGQCLPEDPSSDCLLVRLFGSVDDDEASIVVTEDDVWNLSFDSLSDALKSRFARHCLIFIGYDPEDETFRYLFSEIAHCRAGSAKAYYMIVPDAGLPAVRWAHAKGMRLIDAEPARFLSLLEETLTERHRQGSARKEETPEAPLPSRPYKFLNYFDFEDERIFFGRESECRRLLAKIHAHPLNLLYGVSGSGKTSLICAALMPQLRRQGYTPAYCRVYDDPAGEIRRAALEASGAAASDFPPAMPLHILLAEIAQRRDQQMVIFVDQFEEFLISHDPAAREGFAAFLAAALAEGQHRVQFVLSLREDFLARLSDFRERIPAIFHNEFRIGPLSAAESRTAIVDPARLLGIEVEPELASSATKCSTIITRNTTSATAPTSPCTWSFATIWTSSRLPPTTWTSSSTTRRRKPPASMKVIKVG